MREFSVVGKRIPRVDAKEKVMGEGKYSLDIKLPGMLYGKVLRSPYAHAKILRIDTTKAERLTGVEAVITSKDIPKIPFNSAAQGMMVFPPQKPIEDQYIFDKKVRFIGDGVAAVAAKSEELAEEALDLIEVDYEELPAVFDAEEAMMPDAPIIHEGVERNIAAYVPITYGDVEKGFAAADYIVEDRYTTSRQKQCQMEPVVCLASFDISGKLTVWSPTQVPHPVQRMIATLFQLPMNMVRIISPLSGGGFGMKIGMVSEPYCVALAKKSAKPVKLEYSRTEDFYATESRHPCILEQKTGVKKDGTLVAMELKAILNTGAYITHGLTVTLTQALLWSKLYRCPNVKYEGYCVYTNTISAGGFRGYGGPQGFFALEMQIDKVAEKLGIDPVEFRLKNHLDTGEIGPMSFPIASCGLSECIEKAAKKIGWKERKSKITKGKKNRGMGMGCVLWASVP